MHTQSFTAASVGGLFDQLAAFFDGKPVAVLNTLQEPVDDGIRITVKFEDVTEKPGFATRVRWQIYDGEISWRQSVERV